MNRLTQTCVALAVCQSISIGESLAANIIVTSSSDFSINDNVCTLREAVLSANNNSNGHENTCARGDAGLDTISFSSTILSGAETVTIALTQEIEIVIDEDLAISGLGQNVLSIDGLDETSIFNISDSSVSIENLSLINAERFSGFDANGGAIRIRQQEPEFENNLVSFDRVTISGATSVCPCTTTGGAIDVRGGSMTLTNSRLTDNRAFAGGAISSYSADVVIRDSRIDGNQAPRGGAISIRRGTMLIERSNIETNNATTSGNLFLGGAIYLAGVGDVTPELTLLRSTVANNSSDRGGGIFSRDARLTVVNSTISSNHADIEAGALYSEDSNISSRNSTFSDNYNGGVMLLQDDGSARASFTNSILANSVNQPDCSRSGGLVIMGFDSILETNASFSSGCGGVDVLAVDPMLGSLGNNGGPTQTHLLLSGSPAIGVGRLGSPSCLEPDQRGVEREASICDIGSVAIDRSGGFIVIPLENGRAVVIPQ